MMAEQAKVPAIRFAGFTDPWEQRKFSNLTDRVSMQSSDPDLPQVEYEDIVSGEGTLNKDLRDKEGGKTGIKFYAGDVLYGKLRPYLMNWLYPQFNGVAVGDFWVLRATECDSSFLYRLVQTDSFQRLANVSSGSKMPRADWNLISQSFFAVPADYAEQRVIAKSLAELDDLITLHQRKYDKLVIFKKSMLEKMFPKDGESVPEIRFAGFTDPWEQRKASEVFQIVDDRGHPTLPVLSATQNQGMIYRDDSGRYIGHDESNEIGYKRVLPGDFVVHLRSFQGGFAHSQYEGITSPAYTVFRAKEPTSHSDRFWKHWFMSEHFIAGLSTVTYGIRDGRSISVDEFMNTFLAFPAVEEQAAISRLFDYLDDLITLHQRKLELLQNIKKSLLDKMFV
ncbi:restriction endonuclease subunit S [Bifidobacterium longum]|nr:restriction endonuclease subunit S [Bifidobacterium longum]